MATASLVATGRSRSRSRSRSFLGGYLRPVTIRSMFLNCLGLVFIHLPIVFSVTLPIYDPRDILELSDRFCIVAFFEDDINDKSNISLGLGDKHFWEKLSVTFKEEPSVLIGRIIPQNFVWPYEYDQLLQTYRSSRSRSRSSGLSECDSTNLHNSCGELEDQEDLDLDLIVFKPVKKDRNCLLVPEENLRRSRIPNNVSFKIPNFYQNSFDREGSMNDLVQFINTECQTFRSVNGDLTSAGTQRHEILKHLFKVEPKVRSRSGSTYGVSTETESSASQAPVQAPAFDSEVNEEGVRNESDMNLKQNLVMEQCERITVPSSSQFFHEYLSLSKPVIITGAMKKWKALSKWRNQFLREQYGEQQVHIKMTPYGEYEGVEPISLWDENSSFKIPHVVLEKLPYPDLVVVRPATGEMKFSKFLDLIEDKQSRISAYLEYTSINDYFPKLKEDISEMVFFRNLLQLKHTNIWLSDGNTLGKLHFDPYDNFLCQISGTKQVIMYEPHNNTRLYEGHIQEAELSYNKTAHRFYRKKLMDSTSMVMSPVDIRKPNLQRFPAFTHVQPLNCTIGPGEVLFMPSFWWHEVQSTPDETEHRNLAVNFWYEPFLTREFPCPECTLDVNPEYLHLL